MIKKIELYIATLLVFSGCTGKNIVKKENQESAFIVIKTAKMRYADMGFIYKSDSFVKVEIYSMGQPVVSLDINPVNVCMSTFECMEKKDFNAKMLSSNYPDTLLENIFRGKPIFNKEGLEEKPNGFSQKIKKEDKYDITYSVISEKRVFRDKINKIVIKVKKQ
ncbi:Putative lipoprotein [hydrothermal vent metagenome]|uniref:Putative lipoprotein n=1 Tax=hydrothermal vent metagenome TaxID=652676 RepID=A0A1W1BSJ4_9ZZZZ